MAPVLVAYFSQLADHIEKHKEPRATLRLFLNMILINAGFDYALIRLLRRMIYNYLVTKPEVPIEGKAPKDMTGGRLDFNSKVVLGLDEPDEDVIVIVTPLVLRINVAVCTFSEKGGKLVRIVPNLRS